MIVLGVNDSSESSGGGGPGGGGGGGIILLELETADELRENGLFTDANRG
jgi:hypothetical protein